MWVEKNGKIKELTNLPDIITHRNDGWVRCEEPETVVAPVVEEKPKAAAKPKATPKPKVAANPKAAPKKKTTSTQRKKAEG